MRGYTLGVDGFAAGEHAAAALRDDEVRVQVEHACLEPVDLDPNQETCPGGGLVGRVVECGDAATAFQDAHVLVAPIIACGECHTCRRGAATVCPARAVLGRDRHGGCAESIVCGGRWLTRLDDALNLEGPVAAVAAGPGLRAYAMFCRAGVTAGDIVVILGQGATASILAALAGSRGAKIARAGTGDAPATAADIESQLTELDSHGRPQKLFVCDGEENLALAMSIAEPASVLTVGLGSGRLDFAGLYDREISVLAVSHGHPDLMPELAALVVKGELDLSKVFVDGAIGPESAAESQAAFAAGQALVIRH